MLNKFYHQSLCVYLGSWSEDFHKNEMYPYLPCTFNCLKKKIVLLKFSKFEFTVEVNEYITAKIRGK
jgi:hypothetical protein